MLRGVVVPSQARDTSVRAPVRTFASLWGDHDAVAPAPSVAPVSGAIVAVLAVISLVTGDVVTIAREWEEFGFLLTALLLSSALPLSGGGPEDNLRAAPGGIPMGLLVGTVASQPWTVAVALAVTVPPVPAWALPRTLAWQLWVRASSAATVAIAWVAVQWLPRDPGGHLLRAVLVLPAAVAVWTLLTSGLAALQGDRRLPPPASASWRLAAVQVSWGLAAAAVTIFSLEYASAGQQAFVAVAAAAGAAAWAVWATRALAERERELQRQAASTEEAASQLQQLYRMAARERQHTRDALARELHDRVLQNLGASRTLMRLSPQEGQEAFEGALAAMRGLIDDLRSPVVEQLGLRAAVEQQADRIARQHDVPVSVSVARTLVDLRGPSAQQIMAACRVLLDEAVAHDDCEEIVVEVAPRPCGGPAHRPGRHLSPLPGPHVVVTVTFDGAAAAPADEDVQRLSGQFDGVVSVEPEEAAWALVAEVPVSLHDDDDDAAAATGGCRDGG